MLFMAVAPSNADSLTKVSIVYSSYYSLHSCQACYHNVKKNTLECKFSFILAGCNGRTLKANLQTL